MHVFLKGSIKQKLVGVMSGEGKKRLKVEAPLSNGNAWPIQVS